MFFFACGDVPHISHKLGRWTRSAPWPPSPRWVAGPRDNRTSKTRTGSYTEATRRTGQSQVNTAMPRGRPRRPNKNPQSLPKTRDGSKFASLSFTSFVSPRFARASVSRTAEFRLDLCAGCKNNPSLDQGDDCQLSVLLLSRCVRRPIGS